MFPDPVCASPSFERSLLMDELGPAAGRLAIEHLATCTSTNTVLLERAARGAPSGAVLLTDVQTAGRGRRGRSWVSSPEHSLAFSLLWKFPGRPALDGLSLAAGIAITQALEDLGVAGVGLKWPNDVWLFGRKLGGVLIEVSFDTSHTTAVIGIGLNRSRDPAWAEHIDQPLATLSDAGLAPGREQLLAAVLRRLVAILDAFAIGGFAIARADWEARNALQGLPVRVFSERGEQAGICVGVADDGALILHQDSGARLLVKGGEVSLRPAS